MSTSITRFADSGRHPPVPQLPWPSPQTDRREIPVPELDHQERGRSLSWNE